MKVAVWGGAGEHGRSCYYIQDESYSVLLDCGGKKEAGGVYPLLDSSLVRKLDAVFLSHAHEDHSMALPLLYKLGYEGPVWTTKATAAQLPGYFAAWMNYARSNGGCLPYDETDIGRIKFRYLDEAAPAMQWFSVAPGIRVRWGASGHMAGSVWLQLRMGRRSVFFSGDYCAESCLLRTDLPSAGGTAEDGGSLSAAPESDVSIVDAAYGSDSANQAELLQGIMVKIRQIIARGGHVLLPAPLLGRGQELLLLLAEQMGEVPIAVEPEIMDGFHHFLEWPEWLRPGVARRIGGLLASGRLRRMTGEAGRLELLQGSRPHMIFTADGMLQSDIARWYYNQLQGQARHGIVFTGHLSGDSRRGLAAGDCQCEIVRCRFKVHQGMPDVRRMLLHIPAAKSLLVHASKARTDLLRQQLASEGFRGLHSLSAGEELEIL